MGKKSLSQKKAYDLTKDKNITRLVIFLIGLIVLAGMIKPTSFLRVSNFQSIGKQLSEYGLMALGVGICMMSGGIDLSAVYVANLSGITIGLLMQKLTAIGMNTGMVTILSIGAGLLVGVICGAFNGFLVAYLNIPAMLATLGTYQLYMGIAIVISKGGTVGGITPQLAKLTKMQILKIPVSFIIFILVAVALSFTMRNTKQGRRIHLVGTSQKASDFAGINIKAVLMRIYMTSGLIAALAGVLSLSRITSAKADFGSSYTMQTILIAVLGGVNPDGGFGDIEGVTIAVIILQTLSSLLNMFPQISNYYRDLIWGAALILVLIVNFTIDKRNSKRLQQALNQ